MLENFSVTADYFFGCASVFMLHRVENIDPNRLLANENMKVSPEFLEKFIINSQKNGYEFITLNELSDLLSSNTSFKKKIVMTLDDGYIDNYTKAYPIFKKYNVPFIIYLTTSFPENTAIMWWYVLEDFLLQNKAIHLADGSSFTCVTLKEKNEAFLAIREKILKLDQKLLLSELLTLFDQYDIDWVAKTKELALSWAQIKIMTLDPLVTIGSHTKNHYAFNKITEDLIFEEIMGANKLIENEIGKKVEHFAFPFGSRNEVEASQINFVKSFNFKTVLTTREGNIFKKHKNYLYCLPRIMLTENIKSQNILLIKRKPFVTI